MKRLRSAIFERVGWDKGLGPFPPVGVRDPDDGAFEHGGVGGDGLLDLDAGDVLAAGDDDVFAAVAQLDVAIGMPHGQVPGVEPPPGERLGGGGLIFVVAAHDIVSAHDHLPHALAVPLDVLHVVVEAGSATRPGTLKGSVNDPCTAEPLPPGRTPDGQWPPDRQVSCYWPAHKPLYDLGIDGWWPDQGDGLDGPSKLARIRMYWEGSQLWRPNERPFALHRNGYPGMWRYGAFLWSGDVNSTWETLKVHVADGVNTALSGVHLWGTDIGGFIPTPEYTGELHVRWFQFGAFCPLFRAHGRDWHLRLPWGWNTGELGPNEVANFPGPPASELHNPDVEPICRKYLELRYRLMPYLYSAMRECAQTGVPIVRAMWIHHPDDPIAAMRGDQYFWGRDMLVAPVVEKGATFRRVYLPSGTWTDFWTEESINGGRDLDRKIDLTTMPIYVRAGAILPMGPVRQYTGEPSDEPLTLVVYPGADGSSMVYEDDGESFAYRTGAWKGIATSWKDRDRALTLRLAQNSKMLPPLTRQIAVRVAGSKDTKTVTFAGKPVTVTF